MLMSKRQIRSAIDWERLMSSKEREKDKEMVMKRVL